MRRRTTGGDQSALGGQVGTARTLKAAWLGWSGHMAHPDSPAGGSGPGFFRPAGPVASREFDTPFGALPAWPGGEALPAQTPLPANPPPVTREEDLGSLKKAQGTFVEVEINGSVIADGSGGPANGAETSYVIPTATAPGYDPPKDGKITAFRGKFSWKGKLTIQTKYGAGATASSLSCYGRGTTSDDVRNRDITLGFHESCHRADYKAYLSLHDLPDPPELSIGMSVSDYDAAIRKFFEAFRAYNKAMSQDSKSKTDEVGRKLSDVGSKGCFVHTLP